MKNFSAKTANFQNLKVKDANVISEINLGTAPNQIPLNKDLGSLAYQDAVNLDDVSADMLELRAIAAEISDSAVDVFVYDTSRDSDGGAWRKRTQHTSWYNEELNTETRGGRREFPAVAVIVAEADKVTIYDGDDPDLSMWMVFKTWGFGGIPRTCCVALNGKVVVGSSGWGVPQADFIKDTIDHQWNAEVRVPMGGGIINRNIDSRLSSDDSQIIVNSNVNDVAMTILPNAPIDEDTGLPVPTIAVATNGGVSVIKDDGTVISTSTGSFASYTVKNIDIQSNGNLFSVLYDNNTNSNYGVAWAKNYADISGLDWTVYANWNNIGGFYYPYKYASSLDYIGGNVNDLSFDAIGSVEGLTKTDKSPSSFGLGMTNFISSKYNTGWMPGDIKLATLSDTTVETIGVNSDELVVDGDGNWVGDFNVASDLDSWTKTGDVTGITITGGKLRIERTTALTYATYAMSVVEGVVYQVSVDIQLVSGGGSPGLRLSKVEMDVGSSLVAGDLYQSDNTRKFRADYTGLLYISVYHQNEPGVSDFGNISVRATTELITNGDFSNGTTGWTISSDLDVNVVDGQAEIEWVSGPSNTFHQSIQTIPGKEYILSLVFGNVSGADKLISKIGTVANGQQVNGRIDTLYTQENQVHVEKFVASTTETFIGLMFGLHYGDTGWIDNVSVRPAVDDRSVNNNGLQIVGAINKTPVAPGADLVAYSGFSEYNYLVQPYNEDLDFGTGDFCVMGWFKSSNISSAGFLIDNSDQDTTTNLNLKARFAVYKESSVLKFYTNNNVVNSEVQSSLLSSNIWYFFTAKRANGNIVLYVNGEQVDSNSDNSINLSNTSSTLAVGVNWNRSSSASSEDICLLRISKTAPTAEQIAKIYRDEKPLFQDGAQATLYGTSDAVTALTYDDSENLLHVGTASGRSVFNGLKRVDNTTTAVSTAISATEGLVIEQ